MIELREQFIAKNQVTQGPLDPRKIGERMVGWVTSYQRGFTKYPLTLHTKDLLPVVSTGRGKLAACVQEILSHSPRVPGSHLDHPQWNYHLAPFRRARHQYLSSRLGALTATERPPQWLFAIDQLWWLLDGLRKRHARIRAELEQAREADLRRLREQISMSPREQVFFDIRLNGPPCFVDSFPTPRLEAETLRNHQGQLALINEDLHPIVGQIENAMRRVNRHYDERLKLLDQNCATERAILEKEYNLLMKKHARSAEIPVVRVAPRVDGSSAQNPLLNRLIELGLKVSIGARLLIYRSVIRHLRQVVASAALRGARNVLVVSASPAIISSAAYRFPGIRVFVSTEAAHTGDLARSLDENLKFDLCVLDLNGAELSTFSERLEEVVSCMNAEGTAIGWYLNHGRNLLPESISVDDSISVHIDLAPFPFVHHRS